MPRIMAIDYGTKRTGIAVTDPLQIIAAGLTTVPTSALQSWLAQYFEAEEVELVVVGEPMYPDGNPAQIAHLVKGFVNNFKKKFPGKPVVMQDERYTSEAAKQVILQSGANRKKRRDKSLVDQVSAAIILQDYLQSVGKY